MSRNVFENFDDETILATLKMGKVAKPYQIPWSSNYTFLVELDTGSQANCKAIYKPKNGEKPLVDFPSGTLYKREYAAFLLSRYLGWPSVPITVIREGPFGIGSMQIYIESNPNITYFDLNLDNSNFFHQFAVFDLLANNADRKAGHCLLGSDGEIWSIDHGLTFHQDFKLRTVMMEFWGQNINSDLIVGLQRLVSDLDNPSDLQEQLFRLLNQAEIEMLRKRTESIIEKPVFPNLDINRNIPWPLE